MKRLIWNIMKKSEPFEEWWLKYYPIVFLMEIVLWVVISIIYLTQNQAL